jgi:hypothetical protein
MDKCIVKRKREIGKKKKIEYDDRAESQTLKSATVSVPTCDVSASSVEPSTSKLKIPQKCESGKSEIHVLQLILH